MWIRVTLLKKLGYKCFPSVHFGLVWQVMSVKALGIALKLTFSGMNQLVYPQTWVFLFVVVSCIVTQMNYLNKVCSILWSCTHMNWKFVLCLSGLKNICLVDIVFCSTLFSTCQNYILQALDTFNTAVVSPIYYTMFTSLTILASVIMFKVTDSDLYFLHDFNQTLTYVLNSDLGVVIWFTTLFCLKYQKVHWIADFTLNGSGAEITSRHFFLHCSLMELWYNYKHPINLTDS